MHPENGEATFNCSPVVKNATAMTYLVNSENLDNSSSFYSFILMLNNIKRLMPHYSGNISTNPDKAHFLTFVDVVLLHSSLTLSFSLSLLF